METLKNINNEIKVLISEKNYIAIAQEITDRSGKILCEDLYDVEVEHTKKFLAASNIDLAMAKELILNPSKHFFNFVVLYLKNEWELTQGQEFNPEELPDPINKEESQDRYDGHSRTFLVQDAIFYLILEKSPADLTGFLKKIRTPHHIKFASALQKLYSSIKEE